jgi:hypothetical protein
VKSLLGERFWRKVKKGGPRDCWLWTGSARNQHGHGGIFLRRNRDGVAEHEYVHRLSYAMHVDDLDRSDVVRHTCDNPRCVNPLHLVVGTHADNHRDAVERGRAYRFPNMVGSAAGNSKLVEADIPVIRERVRRRESLASIGADFGVSRHNIAAIRDRKTWSHVGDVQGSPA